jgi:hypothetical protein
MRYKSIGSTHMPKDTSFCRVLFVKYSDTSANEWPC